MCADILALHMESSDNAHCIHQVLLYTSDLNFVSSILWPKLMQKHGFAEEL